MAFRRNVLRAATLCIAAGGIVLIGLTATTRLTPACGCGSVDSWVFADLKQLSASIEEYAAAHDGLFPTYDEVVKIHKELDPSPYAIRMTPEIDILTGNLKFTPTRETVPRIAYAVSGDRRKYVLRGVGIDIKYQHFYFFGRDLGEHAVGQEYPVIKPEDAYQSMVIGERAG